jgi:hypothetical protein
MYIRCYLYAFCQLCLPYIVSLFGSIKVLQKKKTFEQQQLISQVIFEKIVNFYLFIPILWYQKIWYS